jgi:glucuronoarabinoxylan endo-1,4-beta-xylanase
MPNNFATKSRIVLIVVLLAAVAVWLSLARITSAQATVNWGDVHQTIDGFGASSADFSAGLSQDQADFFFAPTGIDLSILRTQIIPDRATCDAMFEKGGCSAANGQILDGELQSAKLAVARGAIVIATPWSPPGSFKTNGAFKNGGSLLPAHYSDWANEIAQFVVMMAHNGVPIYAVSVQNEPDLRTNYGSCTYTAQQIHDFVPYLYAALQSAGVGSTRIIIAEQSSWNFDLAALALADPKVAQDVDIVAAHAYSGGISPYPNVGKHLWQTEYGSQGDVYDGSIKDGIRCARMMHGYLSEANIDAWLWWFLSNMPKQGEGEDNSALTDIHGHYPKRAYITGQWSKFVRPGWSRIGVTNSGLPEITAFKDRQNQNFAIVAINPSRLPITTTFFLNGFTTDTVTPWITSRRWSLAAQRPVAVNGSKFAYTLPAMSVTTFSGASGTHD